MGLKSKIILIVDDDEDIRKLLVRILEPTGMKVLVADGPASARELLKEAPHLILTDLNMEPEDGFSFIQSIKLHPEYEHIPILILSSQNDFKTVKKGIGMGIRDYVLKPIQPAILLQKLKKVLVKQDYLRWDIPQSERPLVSVELKAQISALGETGFTLGGSVKLPPESEFRVTSPLFDELKLTHLTLKTSKAIEPTFVSGSFQNDLSFIGVSEADSSAIRKFLARSRS